MDLLPPVPTLAEPRFTLGRPQARLLLAFAVVVAVVGFAVDRARYTFVVPSTYPRATANILAFRNLPEPPEVLLLGSSRFDFGFDGHLVQETLSERAGRDISVYKLSQRGMHGWLLYLILRDYVVPNPPTELLVLGIDIHLFEIVANARALGRAGRLRDLSAAFRQGSSSLQRDEALDLPFRGLQVVANLPWLLQPSTRAMTAWKQAHSGEFSPEDDQRLTRYMERQKYQVDLLNDDPFVRRELNYDFEGGWFPAVEALLAELPCEVLLVRTPLRSDFISLLPEETWTGYFNRVSDLQETHGWKFIDMTEEPWMKSDDDMRDRVHVTPTTQARISRILGRRLVKILRDRRR